MSRTSTVIPRGDAVYFIASECRTYVKIGRSNNTMKRLKALQTSSPLKLVLLGAVHAKPAYEKYLHACFAKQRTHGEWFSLAPVVEKAIATILGQPTLNFPEAEYAPQVGDFSLEDFFGAFTPIKKPEPETDDLEAYLKSLEHKRIESARSAMSGEQLQTLEKLENAQAKVLELIDAKGDERILYACKATQIVLEGYPEQDAKDIADKTARVIRLTDEALKRSAEIFARDGITDTETQNFIQRQVVSEVAEGKRW